jgi:hypothetical protein
MVYPTDTTFPGPLLYAEPDAPPWRCPARPRAVLCGDPEWGRGGVAVLLDGDPRPCPTPAGPTDGSLSGTDGVLKWFTVRKRTAIGEDVDGNSTYDWTDLLSQVALSWEVRTEVDAAGITVVRATLLIANPGDTTIDESAVVVDGDTSDMWRITQSVVLPGATRLQLDRVTYD